YTRMPEDYDVFRCNQFYFEDKYFLGKKVKAFFAVPHVFYYQYYTYKKLLQSKQYDIENIVISSWRFLEGRILSRGDKNFLYAFPKVIQGHRFLEDRALGFQAMEELLEKLNFEYFYNNRVATSGVYMCIFGVFAGYKEIYITGIDFYANGGKYIHNITDKQNFLSAYPDFDGVPSKWHSQDYDQEILTLLKSLGVKFYSLSKESAINTLLSPPPLLPMWHWINLSTA
ncbi:alpha-2,3-sialyltransferase, partial [Helicobacter sp. 10-6591]|uniref:alpha-2,3-sialyltransferase n=1 Tax=Helicobacter sp. 10-6591 TaxID=2004998 RepID=UPI0011BF2457